MRDLVLGEIKKCRGITHAPRVSSLRNFREIKSAQESTHAARQKGVLLYCPSYELEDGACRELKKSSGALVFSFFDLLREQGFRRAIALSKMRLAFAQCRKSGCGYVVCTLAKTQAEARNSRELEAFQSVLGMNQHEKEFSDRTLERLSCGADKPSKSKKTGIIGC